MERMDVNKERKALHQHPAGKAVRVDTSAVDFLMIEGVGGPTASLQVLDTAACSEVGKKNALAALSRVRYDSFSEGTAAQQ